MNARQWFYSQSFNGSYDAPSRRPLSDHLLAIYRADRGLDDVTDAALAEWPEERARIDRAYQERIGELGGWDAD